MKWPYLALIYVLLILAPLGFSWSLGWPPRSFHQEFASGLGMLAFSIILVEFLLSGRFRFISSSLGMDVTMRVHQFYNFHRCLDLFLKIAKRTIWPC